MNISPHNLTTDVQSPFLPGTQIQYAVDSTSLGMIKLCPRLYYYTMIEGWASKGESIHLRFGIEYHSALENYDRIKLSGADHEYALRDTVAKLVVSSADFAPDPDTKAGKYKSRSNLIRTVIDYLDHFKDDPATTYILENGKPAVELSFRFELDFGPQAANKEIGKGKLGEFIHAETDAQYTFGLVEGDNVTVYETQPYILCGHLDRVVNFNDELYVLDHKTTTTTIGDYFFQQFEPNNQMTLYSLAGATILGSTIKGVIIDAAQIMVDSSRFVRGFTYRSGDQLTEWLSDLRVFLAQAESYAVAGHWPMNDSACGMYGGCRFREVCSKSPHVRKTWLKSSFEQLPQEERWNPLKSRG